MFKFMKSKKGFSLVELMIVVVIMAILVAVAVPIFNSVTGNAREKTCIDNQRQIVGNIGNIIMMKGLTGADATDVFTVKGDTITVVAANLATFNGTATDPITETDIKAAFKTAPCCGDENNTIHVDFVAGENGATGTVTTRCCVGDTDTATEGHVLATTK